MNCFLGLGDEGRPYPTGHTGKHQGQSGDWRSERKAWARTCAGFSTGIWYQQGTGIIGLIGSHFRGRFGGAGEGRFQELASPQDVKASESHSFMQCCKWQEPPFPWGLLKALHKCLIVTGLWVDPQPSWESLCARTAHSVWVKFTFPPPTPTLGWQILQCTWTKTSQNLSEFHLGTVGKGSLIYWEWIRKTDMKGI